MLSFRGLVLSVVASCVVGLFASAGVAWGAAPEAPQAQVLSFTDGSVVLRGVLNPGAAGVEGTYEFLYAASPTSCLGGGVGKRGLSLGFMGEEVFEEVGGLQPATVYSICVLARNLSGEETTSSSVTFTTSLAPEVPQTRVADAITPSGAMLHGVLNLGGPRSSEPGFYEFVYKRSASECEGEGSTGRVAAGSGAENEFVQAEVAGLVPNTQYTFCLRSWNGTGQSATGLPVTFTTLPAAPSVSGEGVVRVGSDSATVTAQVSTGGAQSSYVVRYGVTPGYGAETVPAVVSVGETVSVTLTGLSPSTAYHFSFRVFNDRGSEEGADVSFTTYPAEVAGLPDGRVYEMVSPAYNPYDMEVYETNSGLEGNATLVPFQASASGNTVVYAGGPSKDGTGAQGSGAGNQYRATRSSRGGWSQVNITPSGGPTFTEYDGFSSDLSAGVIASPTMPPFVATESLTDPSHGYYKEFYATRLEEGLFLPLFSVVPPNREPGLGGDAFAVEYGGASADFTHLLFEANDALLEDIGGRLGEELAAQTKKEGEAGRQLVKLEKEAQRLQEERNANVEAERIRIFGEEEAIQPFVSHNELYVSNNGRVGLVNVLPDGRLAPGATFGSSGSSKDLADDISADGSRIFWTGVDTTPGVIYVRVDGTRTLQVSAGPAVYWAASVDGRYAYYVENGGLWRFDVEHEAREPIGGSGAGVVGVVGINQTGEDGGYVYFVATGALVSETNAEGKQPQPGLDNLYVSEPDPAHPGGHVNRFITTLSEEDAADWTLAPSRRTAQVAPDGHSVVFVSKTNLTGHPYPGEGSSEVYDYRVNDGRLFCTSCRAQASGGRLKPPVGKGSSSVFTRRWVSEDGDRVFFESEAPLVTQDVNGANDVYEWEPDGTGACTEVEGCDYLISDGLEATAFLADTSASGNDAFIVTQQRLVAEDQNEMADLYDARVDGVRPVVPPQCTGTGCQGVPAGAPIFAIPASVVFNGVGNFPPPAVPVSGSKARSLTRAQKLVRALAACGRERGKRDRAKCRSRARTRYGAKRARAKKAGAMGSAMRGVR